MRRAAALLLAAAIISASCASDDPMPRAGEPETAPTSDGVTGIDCQWPTFGQNVQRSFRACDSTITAALMITSRKVTSMITVVSTSTNAGQWFTSPSADAPAISIPRVPPVGDDTSPTLVSRRG